MPPMLPSLLAAAIATLPSLPVERLGVEGIGIGDQEGRLITLMPTARCSGVEGGGEALDRWCRMPDQPVFGVNPDSLSASLHDGAVVTVIARVSRHRWPRLRTNLLARLGEPQETLVSAPLPDPAGDAAEAWETLRWTDGTAELVVAPGPGGDLLLTLRPLPAQP